MNAGQNRGDRRQVVLGPGTVAWRDDGVVDAQPGQLTQVGEQGGEAGFLVVGLGVFVCSGFPLL